MVIAGAFVHRRTGRFGDFEDFELPPASSLEVGGLVFDVNDGALFAIHTSDRFTTIDALLMAIDFHPADFFNPDNLAPPKVVLPGGQTCTLQHYIQTQPRGFSADTQAPEAHSPPPP
jgi:hypothetical protein